METNPTQRFSDRVDNYVKYRPNYPPQILDFLKTKLGLTSESVIVDVGSGTGISSEIFLKNGNQVYAIEPNDEMRKAAETALGDYPKFQSKMGRSENTGLQNETADFVVAAQAFHWFEPKATKKEFDRILKKNGRIVLIWNDRKIVGTPFAEEYEALITLFGTDYKQVKHKNVDEQRIRNFMGAFELHHFNNFQEFDFEGLLGRLASSSYAPNADHPRFADMRSALKHLFEKHQSNGYVRIEYDTQLYYSVTRPDFIKHYSEIQDPDNAHYPDSDELLSIGSPFAKKFGLTKLGIHHEVLPPGRRTSWPHAESEEEEFVYVIEGNPDAWVDGNLHRLNPGDAVGFVPGTGICHTFLNNTQSDVRLLVVGEATKKTNKCFYALHPERNEKAKNESWLWEDAPKRTLGNHAGVPDVQKAIHQDESVAKFLNQAGPLLYQSEAINSLMIGLCESMLTTPPSAHPVLLRLVQGEKTVSAAIQTPPMNLVLSECDQIGLERFAQILIKQNASFPGVVGPGDVAKRFAEIWSRLKGLKSSLAMGQKIYELTEVKFPKTIHGEFCAVKENDADIIEKWAIEFAKESLPTTDVRPLEFWKQYALRAVKNQTAYFWLVDGMPAAISHTSRPTKNGISINAVYTPPRNRKNGYASSVVAHLTQKMLDSGKRFCVLYTDLANPTSNKIYQKLGYREIAESSLYSFEASDS